MNKLFIDIETIPTSSNEAIDYVARKIEAPGNYKDPDKIKAYIDDKRDDTVARTSLSGLFGQVYMIGYAFNDAPVDVIYEGNERDTLTAFDKLLDRNEYNDNKILYVGHNAQDFDIPFLSQRLMVNGFKPLFNHNMKPWDMGVDDTMKIFACGKRDMYALEALCITFGIETPKNGIDGSMVAGLYAAGKHQEVMDYCKEDVRATRELYHKLTNRKLAS